MKTEQTIPQAVLDKFLKFMQTPCVEVIEDGEQVKPYLSCASLDDELKICRMKLVSFPEEGRPPTALIAKLAASVLTARAYDMCAFVDEAWTKKAPARAAIPKVSLEDLPDREEAVIVVVYTRDVELISVSPIHRNPNRLELKPFDTNMSVFGGNLSIHH